MISLDQILSIKKSSLLMIRSEDLVLFQAIFGAGKEIRTLDPNLGKVMLYH